MFMSSYKDTYDICSSLKTILSVHRSFVRRDISGHQGYSVQKAFYTLHASCPNLLSFSFLPYSVFGVGDSSWTRMKTLVCFSSFIVRLRVLIFSSEKEVNCNAFVFVDAASSWPRYPHFRPR